MDVLNSILLGLSEALELSGAAGRPTADSAEKNFSAGETAVGRKSGAIRDCYFYNGHAPDDRSRRSAQKLGV